MNAAELGSTRIPTVAGEAVAEAYCTLGKSELLEVKLATRIVLGVPKFAVLNWMLLVVTPFEVAVMAPKPEA